LAGCSRCPLEEDHLVFDTVTIPDGQPEKEVRDQKSIGKDSRKWPHCASRYFYCTSYLKTRESFDTEAMRSYLFAATISCSSALETGSVAVVKEYLRGFSIKEYIKRKISMLSYIRARFPVFLPVFLPGYSFLVSTFWFLSEGLPGHFCSRAAGFGLFVFNVIGEMKELTILQRKHFFGGRQLCTTSSSFVVVMITKNTVFGERSPTNACRCRRSLHLSSFCIVMPTQKEDACSRMELGSQTGVSIIVVFRLSLVTVLMEVTV